MENKIAIVNSRNKLQDKNESTLNNVDNVNTKLRIKLRSKNIESNRKMYHSSNNKLDNNILKPKFKILSSQYALKNVKASNYYNNSINDTKKQENIQMQTISTRESINKKHFIPKYKVDNDTIEHDSCLYQLPISIPKTYIKECHSKASKILVSTKSFDKKPDIFFSFDADIFFFANNDALKLRANKSKDRTKVDRDSKGNRTK